MSLSSKSDKIHKGSKTISCNICLNFNRGIRIRMLGNYSCSWRPWGTKELRRRPCRDSRNRSSSRPIIKELRVSDHIMTLCWSSSSVPWLNLGNQTFSVTVENFIETSHWKLLICHILPRNTPTALAAHLCAAAHRLGSTAIIMHSSNEIRVNLRDHFKIIGECLKVIDPG